MMGCGVEPEADRGAAAGDSPVVELGGIKTCGTEDTPPCPLEDWVTCGTKDTPPCPVNPAPTLQHGDDR
ncbi:MAG TPA: hypothetical protein VHW23_41105 [Kofleriaceae bacterium]|nr:hypothetical protein [Kofleriaceae bacterium]